MQLQYLYLMLISSFFLSSCVAYKGNTLVPPKEFASLSSANKLAINFSNESVIRNEQKKEESSTVKPMVEGYMLTRSDYFLTTQSLTGKEDFHLKFKTITSKEDQAFWKQALKKIYLGISFLSLALIPYYEKIPRQLEVEVIKENKSLKRYYFEDHFVRLTWLLALPWWRPSKNSDLWYGYTQAEKATDEQVVQIFLRDFYKDFLQKNKSSS